MERLKDGHFTPASLEADASELLRGAQPYAVPAALKRNVRVRLVEAAPRRRAGWLFRVAIVAGVLGVVAASFAAVGHVLQKPKGSEKVAQGSALAPSLSAPSSAGTASSAVASAAAAGVGVPLEPSPAALAATDSTQSVSSANVAPDATKHGAADARMDAHRDAAHDPATVSEASLVYETARALRNEGDTAHAARVLDDYFKRYPHGALAEEAQALGIDIAVARGDSRAKSLASHYLAEFPNGHFRAKAERVLASDQ
jgi:hypothetical protein